MEKQTRIVLSFDDGRLDSYRVAREILLRKGLSASFNITPGYIMGLMDGGNEPCKNPPMLKEQVVDLFRTNLFEIAGHGYLHGNDISDWVKGLDVLQEWLGEEWSRDGIGIASPHSKLLDKDISDRIRILEKYRVMYIRIGLQNQISLYQRFVSRVARKTGNIGMYLLPLKTSLQNLGSSSCVYSIPVLFQHSLEQVESFVECAIERNLDGVLQFHSILKKGEPFYENMFSWDYEKFEGLCDYLVRKREKLKIVKCIETFL